MMEELHASGAYVFAGGLVEELDQAFSADATSGELLFNDGPFAETKEWLGGFTIVDVPRRGGPGLGRQDRRGVRLAAGGPAVQAPHAPAAELGAISEQGWREFLAADGVDDWVVLHGGPVAVYDAGSMLAAAQLAVAVPGVPGLEGSRAALTMSGTLLTVRLTRELWGIETEHVDLARAISAVAGEQGAIADRARVQEVQLAVAAKPDEIDLPFWRAVLGYDPMADDNGVDPLAHGSTVWMQDLDPTDRWARDARRRLGRPRARPRPGRRSPCCRRPGRGRDRGPAVVDPRRPRRQQGVRLRLARRRLTTS